VGIRPGIQRSKTICSQDDRPSTDATWTMNGDGSSARGIVLEGIHARPAAMTVGHAPSRTWVLEPAHGGAAHVQCPSAPMHSCSRGSSRPPTVAVGIGAVLRAFALRSAAGYGFESAGSLRQL
jgi:hypothetical protein